MRTYDVGDQVRLSVVFSASDGTPTDPTTVTLRVTRPDGVTSSPTPDSAGSGVYQHDLAIDQAGHWFYRFAGTGALVAAEEGQFYVRERKA